MCDFFERIQGKGKRKEGRLREIKKRQPILLAIIFMLGIRLFFSIFFENSDALAKTSENNIGNEYNLAQIDPLNRVGKGLQSRECQNSSYICQTILEKERQLAPKEEYNNLLSGYPIEEMLVAIGKLDEKTADFIIAIAKKESDWGKHAPSKDGRDCYNYWGYKGRSEKQVLGYSCFSTREEAVEKVGARINNLIEKGINTPERMLVWKCGSTCAGHDPQGVRKWVADVKSVLKLIKS